jgi:hypothetical protein
MGIKRISIDEAQQFIKVSDDYTGAEASYFTLTPSINPQHPASDGWESVTYYTNRSRTLQYKPNSDKQYVYILTNETMPGLCKIGFTKNLPDKRAKQINAATGVAMDFTVEYAYPCYNGHDLEQEVHGYLDSFRVNKNREFFQVTVDEAKAVIQRLGERYNPKEE